MLVVRIAVGVVIMVVMGVELVKTVISRGDDDDESGGGGGYDAGRDDDDSDIVNYVV